MALLTVNTGSSSVRLAAFSEKSEPEQFHAVQYPAASVDPVACLRQFLGAHQIDTDSVDIVGHRVVHGGERLVHPCLIDPPVEAEIERLAPLAPLHNPRALAWVRACHALFGREVPQIAVFDTAFYADLPDVAATYALPAGLCRRHRIKRYGFHGIAHEAMRRRWRAHRPDMRGCGKIISLQLGGGCSITATDGGCAVDTSMGFSPLEGLVMATRCGDVDAGILTYLQRVENLHVDALEHLLNHDSGLCGVSGISGDMRELLASSEPDANLAVGVYCYRARKYIGAYIAALGGVDAILFGGGVGENAPAIRARILAGLDVFGIALDAGANDAAVGIEARINASASRVEVRVVPVNEAEAIARAALAVVESVATKGA